MPATISDRPGRVSRRRLLAAVTLVGLLAASVLGCGSSNDPVPTAIDISSETGLLVIADAALANPTPAVIESIVAPSPERLIVSVFITECTGIQRIDTEQSTLGDTGDYLAVRAFVGQRPTTDETECSPTAKLVSVEVELSDDLVGLEPVAQ